MKITVINGTEKHGSTYNLKEIFLSLFKDKAEITEYYLPKDCPGFCIGCTNCFFREKVIVKIQNILKNRRFYFRSGFISNDITCICFPYNICNEKFIRLFSISLDAT